MSSKTKIVVLHMKEIIYTGIFLILGIILLIFLILLFVPGENNDTTSPTQPVPTEGASPNPDTTVTGNSLYIPGIYNTELVLNDQVINVEVIVGQTQISSIQLVNLSENITTMYPLLQPTFDSLTSQIYEKQSLEDITYEQESKYTSLVLLEAIRKSVEKAIP